ncbi:Kelch repeat-containing protein [Tumebacillus lipolyticus]|uniref:Kelch repeat-containing protein n=1 Tax=Tumebacillus lipolyticus TaxID=1280370 RepID=A0ABW5A3S9_9BACL
MDAVAYALASQLKVKGRGGWYPRTGTGSIPNTIYYHDQGVGFAINGRGYVAGGYDGSNTSTSVKTEQYDQISNSWSEKANFPSFVKRAAAFVLNGKAYISGGQYDLLSESQSTRVYCYDPVTNTYAQKANMTLARREHMTWSVNGKGYVYGGVTLASDGYQQIERYDDVTNTWTKLPNASYPRYGAASAVLEGKAYIFGGSISGSGLTASLLCFDPATETFSTRAYGLWYRHAHVMEAVGGKLYTTYGRDDDGNHLLTTDIYDPVSNTWDPARGQDVFSSRAYASSFVIGHSFYVCGGGYNATPYNTAARFEAAYLSGSEELLTWLAAN